MTTHISKMLSGPAKSLATEGSTPPLDGVTEVRFEGGTAWAIIYHNEKLEMVYGDPDEARAILIQMQGGEVPDGLERRLKARRSLREERYNGVQT